MKEFIVNLKKVWRFAKEFKWKLLLNVFYNTLMILISVLFPIISAKMIINLTNNELTQLIGLAAILLGIDFLHDVINYFMSKNYQIIFREGFIKIQNTLGREILKLDNETMDEHGTGVFIQRLTGDASRISEIFTYIINNLGSILSDIGIFAAIFYVNKLAFIFLFIQTTIVYIIERKRTNKANEKDKDYRKKNERMTSFISELVRGSRDIRMLNSEESFMNELRNKTLDVNQARYDMSSINRGYRLLVNLVYDSIHFFFIVFLVYLILEGKLTAAESLVLYNYSGRVTSINYYIRDILEKIKDFNLSATRVFNILDSNEFKKEKFGKKHIDDIKGNFEFKNVTFAYKDKKILDKLSFKIKSGETVAFVGKSGAGKTTIFNLLCKMYKTKNDSIFIDGLDINKLDKDSIRGNITIISQNPYIFNLSIRDNLRLVKDGLTDEEMQEACKLACLDDFIDTLPQGYDTLIGEGGVNLSGGQKQRLAIARALIQKTKIILFDEATSALDNETQAKIQSAIDNLKGEYTILIIAHRLSTIINSDRILFLNEGKIEAHGSHKELLKTSASYKKLYESEIKSTEE